MKKYFKVLVCAVAFFGCSGERGFVQITPCGSISKEFIKKVEGVAVDYFKDAGGLQHVDKYVVNESVYVKDLCGNDGVCFTGDAVVMLCTDEAAACRGILKELGQAYSFDRFGQYDQNHDAFPEYYLKIDLMCDGIRGAK